MGQGEKLMDLRQPDSPGGEGRREGDKGWSPGREGREEGQREEQRGAIKTLTSNLVYCVKKSHMHSRPPEGPHCFRVALVDTSSWPRPHPPQAGAELCGCGGGGGGGGSGGGPSGQSAGAVGGRAGDRPRGRGKNTKTPHFK